MPVVILPDDLREQLEDSESGTINDTDGSGVAVYPKTDGSARADIYVGIVLDGFTLYLNISSVNRTIKMQFSIRPILFCQAGDLRFDPIKDAIISIKVSCRPVHVRYYAAQTVTWRSIVVRPPVSRACFPYPCARLTAGRVTTLWVKRPLSVSQQGRLSLPSLRGRLNE